ncbi:MAG: putative quinol monooxygenase [Celeribacter sp.]|jgi:quinol monooxygenase YgiN
MIRLTGTLTCPTPEDIALVKRHLPEHIRLTRAEPGCLSFEVSARADAPSLYDVSELFRDEAAFDAHQTRTRASDWFHATAHLPRDFTRSVTDDT